MYQPLVAHVRLCAPLDRIHAGQHVAMCMHNALRFAGRSRGKENLQRRRMIQPRNRARFVRGQRGKPILECQLGPVYTAFLTSAASPTTSFGMTSAATRFANSSLPNASSGTAIAPRSMIP